MCRKEAEAGTEDWNREKARWDLAEIRRHITAGRKTDSQVRGEGQDTRSSLSSAMQGQLWLMHTDGARNLNSRDKFPQFVIMGRDLLSIERQNDGPIVSVVSSTSVRMRKPTLPIDQGVHGSQQLKVCISFCVRRTLGLASVPPPVNRDMLGPWSKATGSLVRARFRRS